MRPRGAIDQAGSAFGLEARDPFARRSRADACGSCGGLRRLPALDHARTMRARPSGVRRAFLWMFIRSSVESLKLRNFSFLGPDRMDNLLKAHS